MWESGRSRAVLVLAAVVLASAGCAETCQNVADDVDLRVPGAATPLEAIDVWRDLGSSDISSPPEDGWVVPDDTGRSSLTLTNPDEDWVIGVARTDDGGWIVNSASANCSD